jgi:RNA polymerase sigma-70 factor (ECF subfamily)
MILTRPPMHRKTVPYPLRRRASTGAGLDTISTRRFDAPESRPHDPKGMQTTSADPISGLLVSVAVGDRRAFARLYEASAGRLYGVALRLLRRRDLADEALQDAYLSIWRNAGRYDPAKGSPFGWMAAIVRYRALDLLRRDRETALDEDALERQPAPAAPSLTAEARALEACLRTLDEKSRRCIQMAFLDGYTHEELARRLDAPVGTVKSWIRRGLMQLKACLDQ